MKLPDKLIVFRLIGGPKDGHSERSDAVKREGFASLIPNYWLMSGGGTVGRFIQVVAINPARKTVGDLMTGQCTYNYEVTDRVEVDDKVYVTCEYRG